MAVIGRWLCKFFNFPVTRVLIALIVIVATVALQGIALGRLGDFCGWSDQTWFVNLAGVVGIITVCLVYAGYVRQFERRRAVELSPKRALREFAAGSAIGCGLFATTIACLWLGGYYRVDGMGRIPSTSLLIAVGLLPAFMEEILIRGIVFRISEESLGTWLATVLSGLLFGFMHMLNPGATVIAAICVAVEAGGLLAAAYVTTRRLWLPIGLHFAWNFTQGGIFGLAVSGQQTRGMLRSTLSGPELIAGGKFGAEASIFAVIICTSMAVILMARAVRNGHIIRPFWSRSLPGPIVPIADEPATQVAVSG